MSDPGLDSGRKRKLEEEEDDEEEEEETTRKKPLGENAVIFSDAYLDTVDRQMLDFDFEKVCSVSLSNLNVYACLVCGKYFQGRGMSSHAYFHSVHDDHHVFINLQTLKVYILPDGYEVKDRSLNDIKFALQPTFTPADVAKLDSAADYSYDLNNKPYLPGFVGVNNIKANDYMNAVVQSLAHVSDLRNFLLLEQLSDKTELVQRFGMLLRKLWSPRAFKGQVSPHEFVQEVSNASQKRFRLTQQADIVEFLLWFLNKLHTDLGGNKKRDSSIIYKLFQGELSVTTQTLPTKDFVGDVLPPPQQQAVPFLVLTLDLPPAPLFQDEMEKNIIPQVPLTSLLSKYDGVTAQDTGPTRKRFSITRLPKYLIFHIKRFTKNNFTLEKNPTIVNFPIKSLDMAEFIEPQNRPASTKYNLVANVCHEGKPGVGAGTYKVYVQSHGREQWFQMQDLIVEEILPQMIFLSESYLQIWEQQS